MSRLSDLQADILRYVLLTYLDIEQHGNQYYRDETAYWGVPWRPFGRGRPGASERAAMSRALRRLEARGLVQRRNSHTGDRFQEHDDTERRPTVTRTICVKLTDDGRRVAERLTNSAADVVNRSEEA